MKLRTRAMIVLTASALACVVEGARSLAQNAYITNEDTNNVSVLNTETNKVVATIPVGDPSYGAVVSPVGGKVYVGTYEGTSGLEGGNIISIDPTTNAVVSSLSLNTGPSDMVVSPDGGTLYVASGTGSEGILYEINTVTNSLIGTLDLTAGWFYVEGIALSPDGSTIYAGVGAPQGFAGVLVVNTTAFSVTASIGLGGEYNMSGITLTPDGSKLYTIGETAFGTEATVIDTATDEILTNIPLMSGGAGTFGLTVSPDGTKAYIATPLGQYQGMVISVIEVATDSVIATISISGSSENLLPAGVAITPEGSRVYVANYWGGNLAVIDTATATLRRFVSIGGAPEGTGNFIIRPTFAGTPGDPTCRGQTRAALVTQFGSFDAAAGDLGFYNVGGLRRSIREFCGGSDLVADEEGR
jgi:YVTN family beta-propeller protein